MQCCRSVNCLVNHDGRINFFLSIFVHISHHKKRHLPDYNKIPPTEPQRNATYNTLSPIRLQHNIT